MHTGNTPFTWYNRLYNRLTTVLNEQPCSTDCQTGLYSWCDNRLVCTIQSVVKAVWQPGGCLFTWYSRLWNRLYNRFDNRVQRTAMFNWLSKRVVQLVWQPACRHDTTGCQTGSTTGWIVYTKIQPVVRPVWQPVWQQVVSCKTGLN